MRRSSLLPCLDYFLIIEFFNSNLKVRQSVLLHSAPNHLDIFRICYLESRLDFPVKPKSQNWCLRLGWDWLVSLVLLMMVGRWWWWWLQQTSLLPLPFAFYKKAGANKMTVLFMMSCYYWHDISRAGSPHNCIKGEIPWLLSPPLANRTGSHNCALLQ